MNIPLLGGAPTDAKGSSDLLASLDRLGNLLEQPRSHGEPPRLRPGIKREAASVKDELNERSSTPLPNRFKRVKTEIDSASPRRSLRDTDVADGGADSQSQDEELQFETGEQFLQQVSPQTAPTPTAEEVRGIKAEIRSLEERCRRAQIGNMDPDEVWEVDDENAVAGVAELTEFFSDGLQDDTESEGEEEEQAGAALAALAAGM